MAMVGTVFFTFSISEGIKLLNFFTPFINWIFGLCFVFTCYFGSDIFPQGYIPDVSEGYEAA